MVSGLFWAAELTETASQKQGCGWPRSGWSGRRAGDSGGRSAPT